MASPFFFFFLVLLSLFVISHGKTHLREDYYAQSCPRFDQIMQEIVATKQISNPTTAAAILRTFFHDCMVDGCDASVLISPNAFNKVEMGSDINENLPGDAFDLITRAKIALELACPRVVSCSDILVVATRNLVKMVGGPLFRVPLGRKDGLASLASHVEGNLPRVNTTINQMINMFTKKGFTIEEMLALTGGGHTIGFSHCSQFSNRIFNFSSKSGFDPTLNPKFAARLRTMCANYTKVPAMAAFNDPITPGIFDNMYFQNLLRGLGLLSSDQKFMEDGRTRPIVEKYAKNQTAFFNTFARAMEKMSIIDVKTGRRGEVRARCDALNGGPKT